MAAEAAAERSRGGAAAGLEAGGQEHGHLGERAQQGGTQQLGHDL